jgi:hypothetical protein
MWALQNDFRNVQMAFSIRGAKGYLCCAREEDCPVAQIARFALS